MAGGRGRSCLGTKEQGNQAEETSERGDGEQHPHRGIDVAGRRALDENSLEDSVHIDPVAEDRLQREVAAQVAGIEGQKEISENRGRDKNDAPRGDPPQGENEQRNDGKQQEGDVQKAMRELRQSLGDGEAIRE